MHFDARPAATKSGPEPGRVPRVERPHESQGGQITKPPCGCADRSHLARGGPQSTVRAQHIDL
jgi:hypothetical protein